MAEIVCTTCAIYWVCSLYWFSESSHLQFSCSGSLSFENCLVNVNVSKNSHGMCIWQSSNIFIKKYVIWKTKGSSTVHSNSFCSSKDAPSCFFFTQAFNNLGAKSIHIVYFSISSHIQLLRHFGMFLSFSTLIVFPPSSATLWITPQSYFTWLRCGIHLKTHYRAVLAERMLSHCAKC